MNVLQQGNWTQEVLAGTNTDKIPGAALANPLDITGASDAGALRWTLTGSQKARIQPMSTVGIGLFANGRFDGSNTQRDDTSAAVGVLQLTATGLVVFYAAAGANPASLTTLLALATNGKLTGKGFYSGAEVAITASNNASFSHGLGATPRLYSGGWAGSSGGGGSGAWDSPLDIYASGLVRIDAVSASSVNVVNASGATKYVVVSAML